MANLPVGTSNRAVVRTNPQVGTSRKLPGDTSRKERGKASLPKATKGKGPLRRNRRGVPGGMNGGEAAEAASHGVTQAEVGETPNLRPKKALKITNCRAQKGNRRARRRMWALPRTDPPAPHLQPPRLCPRRRPRPPQPPPPRRWPPRPRQRRRRWLPRSRRAPRLPLPPPPPHRPTLSARVPLPFARVVPGDAPDTCAAVTPGGAVGGA